MDTVLPNLGPPLLKGLLHLHAESLNVHIFFLISIFIRNICEKLEILDTALDRKLCF